MAIVQITIEQSRDYSIGASFPLLEPPEMGGGQKVFGAGISTAQKALFPPSFFTGTSITATLIDNVNVGILAVTLGFTYPPYDGTYPEPWTGINGFLNLQDPSG